MWMILISEFVVKCIRAKDRLPLKKKHFLMFINRQQSALPCTLKSGGCWSWIQCILALLLIQQPLPSEHGSLPFFSNSFDTIGAFLFILQNKQYSIKYHSAYLKKEHYVFLLGSIRKESWTFIDHKRPATYLTPFTVSSSLDSHNR